MDADLILIVTLAAFAIIALLRLATAVRNSWDGDIEDLYEDVVIRRLVMLGVATAALLAAWLLRGPFRSLLGIALD